MVNGGGGGGGDGCGCGECGSGRRRRRRRRRRGSSNSGCGGGGGGGGGGNSCNVRRRPETGECAKPTVVHSSSGGDQQESECEGHSLQVAFAYM